MTRKQKNSPMEQTELLANNLQLNLFSQFVTNDKSKVSNTAEIWESIPKYFFTPRQVAKLRTKDGLAKPYQWEYVYNDYSYTIKIQPALIEQENGNFKAFFPGVTEELVEEILKKALTIQNHGFHDSQNTETWVRFTLRMIHKELKIRGRSRSIKEIKQAIEVMGSCILTLYKADKEIWKGSILQDLVTVDREEYIADSNSHHICRLPLFISRAINQLEYRQFNYDRLMSCDEQLTRWLYKRLINRFKQASYITEYSFMYCDIKQKSGLLQQNRERDNREKVISAFDELKEKGVILYYSVDDRKQGRNITDVKYTIKASSDFIAEQKAANKRAGNIEEKFVNSNTLPVDK